MNSIETATAICKRFEGCEKRQPDGRLRPYVDAVGVLTLGWGSTTGFDKDTTWTQHEADAQLAADVGKFDHGVRNLLRSPCTPFEIGAMVSLAYNIGLANFGSSTLLKRVNANDKLGAAAQFLVWNKGTIGGKKVILPGLVKRRQYEMSVFLGEVDP